MKGKSCPFLHSTNLLDHAILSSRGNDRPAANSQCVKPPCRFFQAGTCIYGEKCVYLHPKDQQLVSPNVISEPSKVSPICLYIFTSDIEAEL